MKSRFAITAALTLTAFSLLGLAASRPAWAVPEQGVESSQEKAADELKGNMRVMTAAGPDAEAIATILRNAGVTNHTGFVLPSDEGKDTSLAVINLEVQRHLGAGLVG